MSRVSNCSGDLELKHREIKAAKFSSVPSVDLPSETELLEKPAGQMQRLGGVLL